MGNTLDKGATPGIAENHHTVIKPEYTGRRKDKKEKVRRRKEIKQKNREARKNASA